MTEQATTDGSYNINYVPHQLIRGPKVHRTLMDIMIAYVNYLEERVTMFEREMTASHERERMMENAEDVQMNEVRNRNTELEIQNRELRKQIAEKGSSDTIQQDPLGITPRYLVKNLRMELDAVREDLRRANEQRAALLEMRMFRFIQDAATWKIETFGEDVYSNIPECGARLVEEAIETGQSAGVPKDMARRILDKVYSKKPGQMDQELGGTIICWAILISALRLYPDQIMTKALKDCWDRQEEIRTKHMQKVHAGTAFVAPTTGSSLFASAQPSPDVTIAEGRQNLTDYIDKLNK